MTETWVKIIDYPNYSISNFGRIRTDLHRWLKCAGKIHKQRLGGYKGKYARTGLFNDSGHKDFLVHRLVALHFIGKQPTKDHQAAHIDGNSLNNYYKNLKWCLPVENSRDKIIHGTSGKGSKNSMAKIDEQTATKILNDYMSGITVYDLSRVNNFSVGSVRSIIGRRGWNHIKLSLEQEIELSIIRKSNMLKSLRDLHANRSK
jgi:hypothetical protein